MKAWKLEVFFAAVLLCGIVSAGSLVGDKAPEITIREWITENPPNLKNLAERVYIVEFWTTWCPACVQIVPDLSALYNKYKDKGLELIALSQDKSAKTVRQFVRKKGINYPVAMDNGTADWFGVKAYPTVAVINHQGKVIWQGYPQDPQFEKAVAEAIRFQQK